VYDDDDDDDEEEDVPLPRRAARLAGKAAMGVYGALKTKVKSAVAGAVVSGGGRDDVAGGRPVLAASARGAEVAVASGYTVRTFRDEDDFERLLGAFDAPPSSNRKNNNNKSNVDDDGGDDATATATAAADDPGRRVTHVSWAADGSCLAVATAGGDVHVVTRVGRLVQTHAAGDRPRGARGCPAGVALARAARGEGGWELLVVAGSNPGGGSGAGGPLHVMPVHDTAEDSSRPGGVGGPATRTMALPGAALRNPQGVAWNERRRMLAVAGDAASSSGGGAAPCHPVVGLWRYGPAAGEALVPIAFVSAASGHGPAGGGGGRGSRALGFLASWLGAPAPSCHVALRCSGDDDNDDDENGGGGGGGGAADIAVVDPAGGLHVWRVNSLASSSSAAAGAALEPVSLASPDATTGAAAAATAAAPASDPVCSAAWWSAGVLAVSRRSGAVLVAAVPGLVNLLGDDPETFEGAPALACCPRPVAASSIGGGDSDEAAGASHRVVVLETPPPESGGGGRRWRLATVGARSPAEAGLALFTLLCPELGLWVGTFHRVIVVRQNTSS
jgi:hypothetical protein